MTSGSAAATVNAGNPSGGLQPATSNVTTYSLITLVPFGKLLARSSCSLPAGISVTIEVSGATSTGAQPLTTSDVQVLNPIAIPGTYTGTITYTLTATVAAGTLATVPCTVTFTLVSGL